MTSRVSAEDRFWAKVNATGECWLWTAGCDPDGYGTFRMHGRNYRAHRLAYEWLTGPIPDGLTIDHLCRVRHCVRPDHLEPVTNVINVMRGNGWAARAARQTHCAQGHPFDDTNLVIRDRADGGLRRRCHICENQRSKETYARHIEKRRAHAREYQRKKRSQA